MPEELIFEPWFYIAAFPHCARCIDGVLPASAPIPVGRSSIVFAASNRISSWRPVPRYEASMRVLVRRGRLDPPITATGQAHKRTSPATAISEEEINSEVELLRDDEILRRVAHKNGLAQAWPLGLPCMLRS